MDQRKAGEPNFMSNTSMALGIVALFSLMLFPVAIFFACLSLVFAILARGAAAKPSAPAFGGIVAAVTAIVISIGIVITTVSTNTAAFKADPEAFYQTYKTTFDGIYGEGFFDRLLQDTGLFEYLPPEIQDTLPAD